MAAKKKVVKPVFEDIRLSKRTSKRIAELAARGAFGPVKGKKVKAASPRRRPAKKAKVVIPKIKDMTLGMAPQGWQPAPRKPTSRIFKGEMSERGNDLTRSGIDGMGRSHARGLAGNTNSPFALPITGDSAYMLPAGIHTGLSFQGSQAGDLLKGLTTKEQKGITADLKVNAANVSAVQPFFHTPGNAQDAYNLPKSYVEQIRWSRLMFNLNPYIHAVTLLKAYYPLSKFRLTTPEPWVTQFMEACAFNKSFNLYKFTTRMSLSKKKFGEAAVWGIRKQDGVWPQTGQPRWVWESFILLEPELIEVKKDMIGSAEPKYFMRPNRDLEDLVRRLRSNDPEVAHLQGRLAEPIMRKIERRELVPLDASTISAIAELTDGSATRGTPPYQCLFVNFIFEDFVRLALMAQANRYHFPIELWLLGNLEKGIMPSVGDLEALRDLVTNAVQNPPFSIFYPPILDYKALGVQGTLMNIKDDMEYAHKQYLIGMGVNENMILGDSAIFGSNETSGNQSFIRMMQVDRDDIEEWMRWHFFEPLAQWNNLKVNKNGILEPIVPEIEWEKTLDFKAQEDEKENLKWMWDEGLADPETVITVVGKRNPEEIAIKMGKAAGGPFDKDGKFSHVAPAAEAGSGAEGTGPAAPGTPVEAPGGTDDGGKPGKGAGLGPDTAGGAPEAGGEGQDQGKGGAAGAPGGEAQGGGGVA